jgi:antitoxin PrlF
MEISRISIKGQVTIPKSIRLMLELDAGDRILFIEEDGRAYITKASLTALGDFHHTVRVGSEHAVITEVQYRDEQVTDQKKS